MTKKEVYALYGIEYKNGKILSPLGWVPPLLRDGNSKLGKGVWTWSTLPGTALYDVVINGKSYTVRGTCPCNCVGCYAKTGFYRMRSVLLGLGRRTILARDHMVWLERALIAQIQADHIKILRVHCAGDFFSFEYVQMWRHVALACPDTLMWTYTKNQDYEKAFRYFMAGAKTGDVFCLTQLGTMYGKGHYVVKAPEKAAEFYLRASDGGDVLGTANLAWCYANGEGVEKDLSKALKLYDAAAARREEHAMDELAHFEEYYGCPEGEKRFNRLDIKVYDNKDA